MAQVLKCCVCHEEINLNAEAETYPCALANDKSKWVCSEICWGIADSEDQDELEKEEDINLENENLEVIESLEKFEPASDASKDDEEDEDDIEEIIIE